MSPQLGSCKHTYTYINRVVRTRRKISQNTNKKNGRVRAYMLKHLVKMLAVGKDKINDFHLLRSLYA